VSENNEKIHLDEMIRKLKKSSVQKLSIKAEGGERVVRADGSEAIKVQSKKRRNIQPRKEKERKSNRLKVKLILAAVILLLLSVISFIILLGYFNGNRFKTKVIETIVNVSGAEVELSRLDVSPASAKLSTINLKWSEADTLIKNLKLKGISADYGMLAFIGGGWGGSAVGVESADLVLEMGKNNPRLNRAPARPVDFKFGLYQCSELNVNFGKGSLWSFKKGSVSYRVSDGNDDQFSVDNGNLKVPKFGDFKVQTGLVSLAADSAQVYLNLKSEDQMGDFNIDGVVGYSEGSPVDLNIELKDYSLKNWIDPRARRFFNGEIQTGKGTLKMKLGDIESFDITMKITSRLIRVNDFEFVRAISEYLQEEYYVKPDFVDESKMTMIWTKDKVIFTDIELLQDTQMRIRGNFMIDANDLMSGTLKVGLPAMVISTKRGAVLKEVFSEDDGEYIWADVIISGKSSTPRDNLDEMLKEASIKKSPVKVDAGAELFELKFNKLTK
jgi:hypothetical protein